MNSTFSVYAVPFGRLKRVPGSRDRDLVEAIAGAHEYFFAQIDELADEEDEVLSCQEALAQVVEGYPFGYILEAVCGHLGREFDGVYSISRASGWLGPVDEFLRARGVSIALSVLVFGACPVDIPTPNEDPFIGS